MKNEKISWATCPRCKLSRLKVSELPDSIGRTCYTPACYYWDFKTKPKEELMKNGTNYDCHGQTHRCQAFYGYPDEIALLGAIFIWRCAMLAKYPHAILHAINLETSVEEDEPYGALVLWSE